jgi:hypothetical protein
MPAFAIHERLVPYRILAYALYANPEDISWIQSVDDTSIRINTGDAARALRMKNANLWEALYWLETNQLISKVKKEHKRGTAILVLKQPGNILI